MPISASGVGSGLDINSLIEKLMTVERQPLNKLDARKIELDSELSAQGRLRSAIATFRDAVAKLSAASSFKVFTAKASDEAVLGAAASATAAKGNYAITVDRIAENHRRAANVAFANTDTTTIGAAGNTMTITVGTAAFTVSYGGKTLGQIRDAINNATDNKGVTASIIKDSAGYRLLLAGNATGSTNAVSVSYSAADPFSLNTLNADRDGSGGFTSADLDAKLSLEGQFNLTSPSNTLTETIQGVTLTLKKAGSVTLTVDRDDGATRKAVEDLGNAFTTLVSSVKALRLGVLKSQNTELLGIENQLRRVLGTAVTVIGSSFSLVSEVGLAVQKDGSLKLDGAKFDKALAADYAGIVALFSEPTNGVAVRLQQVADRLLAAGGTLDDRADSLNQQVRRLADQRTRFETQLDAVQRRYVKQFGALDSLVANLQSTGNFLTQQLANVSSIGSRRR